MHYCWPLGVGCGTESLFIPAYSLIHSFISSNTQPCYADCKGSQISASTATTAAMEVRMRTISRQILLQHQQSTTIRDIEIRTTTRQPPLSPYRLGASHTTSSSRPSPCSVWWLPSTTGAAVHGSAVIATTTTMLGGIEAKTLEVTAKEPKEQPRTHQLKNPTEFQRP